jgi:D-lactate dehydrogenase
VIFYNEHSSSESLAKEKDYDLISTFVHSRVDSKIIDACPNLAAIFARGTGYDNIDTEYAKQKGIEVFNVPSYGTETVAEFTFALILSLVRNIPKAMLKLKHEKKFIRDDLSGIDISKKTLGVIGSGKIGKKVINIALGFNMHILCFDINPDNELAKKTGFEYVSLDELLKNSDIVTLHTPLNPGTKNLINSDNIFLMKKSAYLINTARGSIIETSALVAALESGSIAGAALDVLENENNLSENDFKLINMENVIVTPHIAFLTAEAEDRIRSTVVSNILNFIKGTPVNSVF